MMKHRVWMMTGVWLIICMAVCAFCGAAPAEEVERADTEEETFSFQFRVDPEEAERQYLNGLFGLPVKPEEELPRMRGTVSGDSFPEGSKEQILYSALRDRLEQVAAGTLASTKFAFSGNDFETVSFTARDLGLQTSEMFGTDGRPSAAATQKILEAINAWAGKTVDAVLYDASYETFWRDLGYSIGISQGWYKNSQGEPIEPIMVDSITVKISVSEAYQDKDAGGNAVYTVDHSRIDQATDVMRNADDIISAKAGLDDYGKLQAYKDEICRLTDYNHAAADDSWTGGYGDPWQMIYVFDGDPETKAVCEGYSKAFYYLCDHSEWSYEDAVKVISASGYLWSREDENSAYESGRHMWNIVRMNEQYYMADVTNTDSGNTGLFLAGYDRHDETNGIYFYDSGVFQSGAARDLGYSFNNETITLLQDRGWLDLSAEEAPFYPNQYETANAVWGISRTEVLPGEPFAVYVTYRGQDADEIILQMTQGDQIIRYTVEGNTLSGVFRTINSTEPASIQCMVSINGQYRLETYTGPLTIRPGRAAPVPAITITGSRATGTDGSIRFQITAEAPDNGDYSDVLYEITPVGEGGNVIPAIGGVFAAGTTQEITMEQVRQTGIYLAENYTFRLRARAYGPGYESETAASPRIYVTGARDEGFTIAGSYMTGNETARMLVNAANKLTVTAPEGVDSIEVCRGDNQWTSYSIAQGNEIQIDGYEEETADVPLVARYTDAAGGKRYSNVIFTDYVTELVWEPIMPESIVPGEDTVILFPEREGAARYQISVEDPDNSEIWFTSGAESGAYVIPAMVFADGGRGYMIITSVYRENEDPDTQIEQPYLQMYWKPYQYNAEAYTGEQTLTIEAGAYSDGLQTIRLSAADAEQAIIQEKGVNYFGCEYWGTLLTADHPGEAADIRPRAGRVHLIRAAVKKNGVWSAWSPVIEVTTPITGRCNESIGWTLDGSGKLTITGTGVIPGSSAMTDPWSGYREEIAEVEIGEGITGTGDYAFSGYSSLTAVTVPASLTSIGEGAFMDCTSLTDISTPGADTAVHRRCYDSTLKIFSLPETLAKDGIGYAAFLNTPAFGQNIPLEADFEIPADTGRIEEYAFYGIAATHVRITPHGTDGLVIGEYAFGSCEALQYFQAEGRNEETEYSIAGNAFDGCGAGLTFIGEDNGALEQYAEENGFEYLENETIGGEE